MTSGPGLIDEDRPPLAASPDPIHPPVNPETAFRDPSIIAGRQGAPHGKRAETFVADVTHGSVPASRTKEWTESRIPGPTLLLFSPPVPHSRLAAGDRPKGGSRPPSDLPGTGNSHRLDIRSVAASVREDPYPALDGCRPGCISSAMVMVKPGMSSTFPGYSPVIMEFFPCKQSARFSYGY